MRTARKNKRMTGEQLGKALADAMGRQDPYSKQTITNWEKDRNQPDLEQVGHLCAVLGVTADHLIRGVGSNLSVKALQLASVYDSMPPPRQGRLLRLAEIAFESAPGDFGDEGWTDETGGPQPRVQTTEPRFLK